jgi:hypothetical protein
LRCTGARELAVATLLRGDVDDHRAGAHALDRRAGDDLRGRPTGHRGRGDDGIRRSDARVEYFLLLAPLLLGELAGVAALTLCAHARIDELGPERAHLLAGCAAHVVRLDDRAQAPGRRDRLQACNAGPDHEDLGRADGTGGCGQHWQELGQHGRGDQSGLVAGDRRL